MVKPIFIQVIIIIILVIIIVNKPKFDLILGVKILYRQQDWITNLLLINPLFLPMYNKYLKFLKAAQVFF